VSEKWRRHQFLRELVGRVELETQEAVAEHLRRAGFHVTQATVSRDIRELNLVKIVGPDGRHRYALPPAAGLATPESRLARLLAETYVSVARAQNLVLLKVLPGNAHAVAAVLDSLEVPGLLGTVAGDDTCLIVLSDADSAAALEGRLRPAHAPPPPPPRRRS
jgi:transcriptional regulator of arginine metabolism